MNLRLVVFLTCRGGEILTLTGGILLPPQIRLIKYLLSKLHTSLVEHGPRLPSASAEIAHPTVHGHIPDLSQPRRVSRRMRLYRTKPPQLYSIAHCQVHAPDRLHTCY